MYANSTLTQRAVRLLALAAALCVVGAAFVLLRYDRQVPQAPGAAPTGTAEEPLRVSGPEVAAFNTFVFDPADPWLHVGGTCADAYYAVLIYAAEIDYRKSPLDFRYNTATPCPQSGVYTEDIALAGLPLVAGKKYYVIEADQGSRGAWYNAR